MRDAAANIRNFRFLFSLVLSLPTVTPWRRVCVSLRVCLPKVRVDTSTTRRGVSLLISLLSFVLHGRTRPVIFSFRLASGSDVSVKGPMGGGVSGTARVSLPGASVA